MKKLVCIIIAIAMMPVCAFADEPFDSIDSMNIEQLTELQDYIQSKIDVINGKAFTNLSAKEITDMLVGAGFPMYGSVDYTEETDSNGLLGRPGGYTSKCNSYDRRVTMKGSGDPSDVAIEVFSNQKDCEARYNYIDSLGTAFVGQYLIKSGNVLFRVDNSILPSEAKEYEMAIESIVKGENVSPVSSAVADSEAVEVLEGLTETSRKNPAMIGERVFLGDVAITVLHYLQGTKANMIAKSFDRYNTGTYSMEKNEEWALAFMKIEGFETLDETIMNGSYDFGFISKDGMLLSDEYSYMNGNPREINNIIPDSVQYCWYGAPIAKGSDALLRYDNYELGEAWFDLSTRKVLDTSQDSYETYEKNDTGIVVDRIQIALVEYGYLTTAPTWIFDNYTANALKKFKQKTGLAANGVADEETLRRLFSNEPIE